MIVLLDVKNENLVYLCRTSVYSAFIREIRCFYYAIMRKNGMNLKAKLRDMW